MYLGKFTASDLNLWPYDPISCKRVPVHQHNADMGWSRHTCPICIFSRSLRTLNKTLLNKVKLPNMFSKVSVYDKNNASAKAHG